MSFNAIRESKILAKISESTVMVVEFNKLILCHSNIKYVLKRVSFGSKDCTKELKLECPYFLGQTS